MLTVVYVVRAAMTWMVVVSRYGLVRRAGSPRAVWVSVLCVAVVSTVQVFPVYRALAAFVGDSRYASAVLLSLALCSALANRLVILSCLGRPARSARWDCLAVALAFGVMLLPVIGASGPAPASTCVGTCGWVGGTWRTWVHWLPVLSYMAWSFGCSCVCWCRYGSRCDRPGIRTGFRLVSFGCALNLVGIGFRVLVLGDWHTVLMAPRLQGYDDWAEALAWVLSGAAVGIGVVWEPLQDQARAVAGSVQAVRSLWRLRKLWRTLVASQPEVALAGPPWTLHPPGLGLVRCVVEICDCLRAVETSISSEVLAAIEDHVASTGAGSHRDAEALVTAAMLRWWVSEPWLVGPGASRLPGGSARDLAAAARWLERVAHFFAGPGSGLADAAVASAKAKMAAWTTAQGLGLSPQWAAPAKR